MKNENVCRSNYWSVLILVSKDFWTYTESLRIETPSNDPKSKRELRFSKIQIFQLLSQLIGTAVLNTHTLIRTRVTDQPIQHPDE